MNLQEKLEARGVQKASVEAKGPTLAERIEARKTAQASPATKPTGGLMSTKADPDAITSTIGRGVDKMQANYGGGLEALGQALGSDTLEKMGGDYRDEQLKEAEQYGQPTHPTTYKDVDVTDPSSVGGFVQELVGGAAGGMGAALAGGIAGAKATPGSPIAKAVGGAVGTFMTAFGMNVGEVQNAIKEADPDAKSPYHSLLAGGGMSLLDSAGAGVLLKPWIKTLGADVVSSQLVKQGLTQEAAKGLVKSGLAEGTTEAIQSGISKAASLDGAGKELDSDAIMEDMINGFIGGKILGGAIGGVSGAHAAAQNNAALAGTAYDPSARAQARAAKVADPDGLVKTLWKEFGSGAGAKLDGFAKASEEAKSFADLFRADQTGKTASGKTLFEDAELMTGKWRTKVDEVTKGMSNEQLQNLFTEASGPKASHSPAAAALRAVLDDVHNEAKSRNLGDIGTIDNYMPFTVDPEHVKAKRDDFVTDITPYFKDRAAAEKAVDSWFAANARKDEADLAPKVDRLVTENTSTGDLEIMARARKDKNDPDTMRYRFAQGETVPEFGHLENTRAFGAVPQQVLNKYVKEQTGKQKRDALNDYFEGASHRLAFTKEFGPKGELANARIAKAVFEAQKAGRKPSKGEVDRMYDMLDAYNGMLGRVKHKGLKTAQSVVGAGLTLKTLPFAAISSFTEFLTPVIRGDFSAAAAALAPTAAQLGHDLKRTLFKGVNRNEFAQVASEANISLTAATSVMGERLGAHMLSKKAATVTKVFFLANGLTMLTHINRVYAGKTADQILSRNLGAIANGLDVTSARGQYYTNQLRQMGVDIRSNGQAKALYAPSNPSEVKASHSTRVLAIRRFVDSTVLDPNLGSTPLWMNEGKYQMLAMLKRYPSAFGNTILPQLARKFDPEYAGGGYRAVGGAAGALFTIGLILTIGYAQDEIKQVLKAGEVDYDDHRTPAQRFNDVMNITLMPLQLSIVSDMINAPRYGSSPLETPLGPVAGFVKETVQAGWKISDYENNPAGGVIAGYLFNQTAARPFKGVKEALEEAASDGM